MKKTIYALLLAILPVMAFSLVSCDNDDNMPKVDLNLELNGGVVSDGTIYVLQGNTLNIEGVSVTNLESNKDAAVTNVAYYLNGMLLSRSIISPFALDDVITAEFTPGTYTLGMTCTILAVDKSIATGSVTYPIKVVATAEEMPSDGQPESQFAILPK